MAVIAVAVCAPGHITLAGLAAVLAKRPEVGVVGMGRSPAEVAAACSAPPEVLLAEVSAGVDLDLPPALAGLPVVVTLPSSAPAAEVIRRAQSSALGVASSNSDADLLVRAIEAAKSGRRWVDPMLAADALGAAAGTSGAGDRSRLALTDRELEVLTLVAHGASATSVGRRANLSANGVKWYLKNLRERVHARNTTHLVGLSVQVGAIRVDVPKGIARS